MRLQTIKPSANVKHCMRSKFKNKYQPILLCMGCALGFMLWTGCRKTQTGVKQVDDTVLLRSFLEEQPALAPVFAKPAQEKKTPFALNVYVDQSASMRGYLDCVGETPPKKKGLKQQDIVESGPRLFSLLRQLANQSELLRFHAFGKLEADTGPSPDTVTELDKQPPVNARDYTRRNNDYAHLIGHIKQQEPEVNSLPVQHMIISDGVQSHHNPGDGSALSMTIARLKEWIDDGGIVEVRLIKSSFTGKYYSEELRAFQQANASKELRHSFSDHAPARPFLVISLLSGAEVLPAWNIFWERSGMQSIEVEKTVLFPDMNSQRSRLTMKFNETVSKKLAPEMKFPGVWKNLMEVPTVDGYRNLFSAQLFQIKTNTSNEPETYPVVLHLEGEEGVDVIEAFKAARPTLRIWKRRKPSSPAKTETVADKNATPAKAPVSPLPPEPMWVALNEDEFKGTPADVRRIFVKKPDPFETFAPNKADLLLRLPLQPIGEKGDIVVLTLTEAVAAESEAPDFRDFSCIDDSTAETLDRIYNLQQWVEQFSQSLKPVVREEGLLVITHR
jgi:hypothetical protein